MDPTKNTSPTLDEPESAASIFSSPTNSRPGKRSNDDRTPSVGSRGSETLSGMLQPGPSKVARHGDGSPQATVKDAQGQLEVVNLPQGNPEMPVEELAESMAFDQSAFVTTHGEIIRDAPIPRHHNTVLWICDCIISKPEGIFPVWFIDAVERIKVAGQRRLNMSCATCCTCGHDARSCLLAQRINMFRHS